MSRRKDAIASMNDDENVNELTVLSENTAVGASIAAVSVGIQHFATVGVADCGHVEHVGCLVRDTTPQALIEPTAVPEPAMSSSSVIGALIAPDMGVTDIHEPELVASILTATAVVYIEKTVVSCDIAK